MVSACQIHPVLVSLTLTTYSSWEYAGKICSGLNSYMSLISLVVFFFWTAEKLKKVNVF